jgi:hypothetical protein
VVFDTFPQVRVLVAALVAAAGIDSVGCAPSVGSHLLDGASTDSTHPLTSGVFSVNSARAEFQGCDPSTAHARARRRHRIMRQCHIKARHHDSKGVSSYNHLLAVVVCRVQHSLVGEHLALPCSAHVHGRMYVHVHPDCSPRCCAAWFGIADRHGWRRWSTNDSWEKWCGRDALCVRQSV